MRRIPLWAWLLWIAAALIGWYAPSPCAATVTVIHKCGDPPVYQKWPCSYQQPNPTVPAVEITAPEAQPVQLEPGVYDAVPYQQPKHTPRRSKHG